MSVTITYLLVKKRLAIFVVGGEIEIKAFQAKSGQNIQVDYDTVYAIHDSVQENLSIVVKVGVELNIQAAMCIEMAQRIVATTTGLEVIFCNPVKGHRHPRSTIHMDCHGQ